MSNVEPDPESGPSVDLTAIESDLIAVEAALARIESGDYGRCVDCGTVIDDALLADNPLVAHCGAHSPAESGGATGVDADTGGTEPQTACGSTGVSSG